MGVGKDWRNHNLALLHHRKHRNKQLFFWKWCFLAPARRLIRWTLVCGVLLFVLGLVSLCIGHVVSDLDRYSHRIVNRSWYYKMNGAHAPVDIWKSEFSKFYYGCSERGPRFTPLGLSDIQVLQVVHSPHLFSQSIQSFTDSTGNILAAVRERSSNGYLLIAASGGLNQQRTGITDAVVVSWILNATLVVPELDHNSFWKDDSDFIDIFDVDWFISSLAKDVTIVKRVPDKVMRSMLKPPYTMRVPRKSEPDYYLEEVLPVLLRRHVVQLTKFDYRLANDLDEELQKLRCRVNYHALKFTEPISGIGQLIVLRMRKRARRFISVHLRFEPDMLAFSGCYFGGGDKERYELGEIRKRWTTLPETTPNEERKRGKCPLTPHEVGLMLRALGYNNDSLLYVASGDIYGGEETLRPLRELFPNFYTKEMLAGEELQPFLSFSSRLAAIDYIVCEDSDVFVTNNNGNMAKILAGRRRYIGHKRTIRPNAKRLSALFMARDQMDWDTFAEKVKSCQRDFMGDPEEMRPGRGEFHEYPSSCICKRPLKYFHVQNNYDGNGSSRTVPILDTKAEYGDHQSTITMQGINNSKLHEVSVSSTEADDDDEFLGD